MNAYTYRHGDTVIECFQIQPYRGLQDLATKKRQKKSNCWTQFVLQSEMTIFSICLMVGMKMKKFQCKTLRRNSSEFVE